ncbi:MAG: Tellurite resistance protein TerB [Hyphomicrobiales bacterium]|nr:MAG: Tellurite resistance protein TerB [Hyphomicrobiales bacterium]
MPQLIQPQTALIYVMVTMSAVDRVMDDAEIMEIGNMVRYLPVFKGYNPEMMIPAAQQCADILDSDDGLNNILELISGTLPESLHDTAYALAVEVASANLNVKQEELRFLQLLRDRLHLDKLTVAAIERGAQARHRRLPSED